MEDQLNKPWLDQDAIFILGQQHKLPKNLEKWIPKSNPDERYPAEDQIKTFM